MISSETWLPLFPLNAVLFPQGILPLKVFEARYTDMVRDCMKGESPFGVVLIKSGAEIGAAAEPEDVGTLAYIKEWDMENLGVLLLRIEGGARFRILETRVLDNKRLEARVETLPPDELPSVSDAHLACARSLKIVIDEINAKGRADQGDDFESPFADMIRLDEAGWVANRWCEILPIPLKARQKLMELEDAESRLSVVHQYLRQHKIV
jgi:Lon protease-like protein